MGDDELNFMGECQYMDTEDYKELKGFVLVSFNCGNLTSEKLVEINDSLISPSTSVLCLIM